MSEPKKILLLSANPQATGRLRVDEEMREIKEGLKRARNRDDFTIESAEAVRYRDLRRAVLDNRPNIVHFSGHGDGEAGLVFEDELGQVKLINAEAIAGSFKLFADTVECVVLNACYSQVQAEAITEHIPYVIGMGKAIGDRAAIEFAIAFYDAIGSGRNYEFAFEYARNGIDLAGIVESDTPKLLRGDLKLTTPLSTEEWQQGTIESNNNLAKVLQSEQEDSVKRYLTRNSHILRAVFGSQFAVNESIPKFSLGNDHIIDFIVITGQSFHYDIILIKLGSPFERPFTKDGKHTESLNNSLEQVNDWFTWIHENEDYFLRSLVKVMNSQYGAEQLYPSRHKFRDNGHYRELISTKIVIGQRNMLTEEDNKCRATIFVQGSRKIEVLPYDRLSEIEMQLKKIKRSPISQDNSQGTTIGNYAPNAQGSTVIGGQNITGNTFIGTQNNYSTGQGSQKPQSVSSPAIAIWQEKLAYLQQQEAIASNPAQKFELQKQIEECSQKIRELGG